MIEIRICDRVVVDHPSCTEPLTMVGYNLDVGGLILQPSSGPSLTVHPDLVRPLVEAAPIVQASPGARNTDPDTSHMADAETSKAADQNLVLLTHADHPDGLTDFELGAIHGRQQTSLGKRRHDLEHADVPLIEFAGLKRPAPSGSLARVWRITAAGIAAANRLRKATA